MLMPHTLGLAGDQHFHDIKKFENIRHPEEKSEHRRHDTQHDDS